MSYNYLVSVRLMVYNHELFIREALQNVLNQKTNFSVEVVIGDDFSTDRSLEIIREFQSTENIHIKVLERQKGDAYCQKREELGRLYNFYNIVENCSGKYVALLDGDDYWTDPYKLQKQVDFLENNPDFNLVGHHAVDSHGNEIGLFQSDVFSFEDIYYKNKRIPTAAIVYRNNFKIPDWFFSIYGGDRAIIFLNAQKGKVKILPFTGAYYRIHEGGVEQLFKKDKFKKPIRNIQEEIVYYNLVKKLSKAKIVFKKIIKNHLYIMVHSIPKLKVQYFFQATYSLFFFLFFGKVKINSL